MEGPGGSVRGKHFCQMSFPCRHRSGKLNWHSFQPKLTSEGFAMEVAAPRERSEGASARFGNKLASMSSVPTTPRAEADDDARPAFPHPAMPEVGDEFEGFAIAAELGRGSF